MDIDYDKPGHCCKCHQEIAEFGGSDSNGNMTIIRMKGNASETEFVMSDGSKMRVAMCLSCKDTLMPEDAVDIMDSVISGWEHEHKFLPWSNEKKATYMAKYSQLEIMDRNDLKWNEDELARLDATKAAAITDDIKPLPEPITPITPMELDNGNNNKA